MSTLHRNQSPAIILHGLIFLFMCAIFVVSFKAMTADWSRVELKALDRLRPETFKYLYPNPDKDHLKLYETYFRRVRSFFGDQFPEIDGLLGYCAYERGDLNQAADFYQKALALNPQFFWYHYNLGVIYYQRGKYDQSFDVLQSGISLDLKLSLAMIVTSTKIYVPIIQSQSLAIQNLANQLEEGRSMATQLAALCQFKMRNIPVNHEESNDFQLLSY